VDRTAPRMAVTLGIVFAMLAPAQQRVHADDWPAAQIKEVFSKSREWFVRVTPGNSLGELVGFAGAPKGKRATATFYQLSPDRSYRLRAEMTLPNPVAPVLFLVTDRGYLFTLDNWHNMGHGKALASYAPDGRTILAAELADVFSKDEIQYFRRSVSSIWWRTDTVYVREGQQSAYVALDDKGTELIVEVETGRWQFCGWRGRRHECRAANDARVWQPFREPALKRFQTP
jgi:hypothetical protein